MSHQRLARIGLTRRAIHERRTFPRHPLCARALVRGNRSTHALRVADISRGGALLYGAWQPELHQRVTLTVQGEGAPLVVNGRVCRVKPGPTYDPARMRVALQFGP